MNYQIEYNNHKYVYQVMITESKEVIAWYISLDEAIDTAGHYSYVKKIDVQVNAFPLNTIGQWGECLGDNFKVLYSTKVK